MVSFLATPCASILVINIAMNIPRDHRMVPIDPEALPEEWAELWVAPLGVSWWNRARSRSGLRYIDPQNDWFNHPKSSQLTKCFQPVIHKNWESHHPNYPQLICFTVSGRKQPPARWVRELCNGLTMINRKTAHKNKGISLSQVI